jgi:hypothetical protein
MFNFNRIIKCFQGQINPNKVLFQIMKKNGYAMKRIRKSLIDLNGINLVELSKSGNLAHSQVYETLRGLQKNTKAMGLISNSLGLEQNDLFPE